MYLRLLFFILSFAFAATTHGQVVPDSLLIKGDSVKTIESDTSITYVIKRAPVRIKERIEISKPKINRPAKLCLSVHVGLLAFIERTKAQPGYEDFLSKVNDANAHRLSYSFSGTIWRCPKKIYVGIDVHFYKLRQKFTYVSSTNTEYSSINRLVYAGVGLYGGYKFSQKPTLTLIAFGGILGENLSSFSGYTLYKNDPSILMRLNTEILYKPYLINLSVGMKALFAVKNIPIEVEPYIILPTMAATNKENVYSLHQYIIGIRMGFTNYLF